MSVSCHLYKVKNWNYYKSDTVIVESVEDAWAKINFNGKVAYVNANYLEEVEAGNLAEKMKIYPS